MWMFTYQSNRCPSQSNFPNRTPTVFDDKASVLNISVLQPAKEQTYLNDIPYVTRHL